MSDKKQFTHMSQFSIIRELPPSDSCNNNNKLSKKHCQFQQVQQQKTSELKFKIEPIGIQPEDDDDLETCPSRTRSSWPHQIIPWWKPADRFEKPPYSYATLIAHAILTSKDGRLTLSDIYKWISEAYPYYKRGQKGWQNSIRHNLSLNKKWFIKVDRRPTQAHPGKGGYWTLQLNMEKIFVENLSQAGGHSRRHHDMGIYSSLSTQYYSSATSLSSTDDNDLFLIDEDSMCPNIHITRPEDYEAKKKPSNTTKSISTTTNNNIISAPRIRNMTTQEKNNLLTSTESIVTPPKTNPKHFVIRFNELDSTTMKQQRRKATDPPRPPPKSGKRRNPIEPGSSTTEKDDEDSAVDIGSYSDLQHISKKRKSTTTKSIDTITASALFTLGFSSLSHNTKPSDLISTIPITTGGGEDILGFNNNDFWVYDEPGHVPSTTTIDSMLLASEYPLFDVEAQNILNGLQQTTTTGAAPIKTIDLQFGALEKNIHYSNMFNIEEFSDPNTNLFITDLNSYNLDQYLDFDASQQQPSDLLLEEQDDNNTTAMDTYWPTVDTDSCYMNFSDANNTNSMPFINHLDD